MKIFSYYNMEESPPSKKKRCPKGTRRNKEGICVPVHKSPPKSPPTPKLMQDDMPTETKPKRKLIVKNTKKKTDSKMTDKIKELQDQFKQDIIVPVGTTTKCPKGTRRNKDKQCVLTKEFKDTFIKRKACIQSKRDELV